MDINQLVKDGNFAQIMRECFLILETRHAGESGKAYKQTVDLRAYLQSVYECQSKKHKQPVSIAAFAALAYKFLQDGKTILDIQTVLISQFIESARRIEQMFEPYNARYTTLPILDTSENVHSADTEPIQQGSLAYIPHNGTRFDPHDDSILPGEALKKLQQKIDGLSPTDKVTAAMQKIVDQWAQRQGLKGSDDE